MLTNGFKILALPIISLMLIACSHNTPAPVYDLSSAANKAQSPQYSNHKKSVNRSYRSSKPADDGKHLVKPGETLFSIAWRYSLDPKAIARINHIKNDRIYPGQKLQLEPKPEVFSSKNLLAAINQDFLGKKTTNKSKQKTHSPNRLKQSQKAPQKVALAEKTRTNHSSNRNRASIGRSNQSVKQWIWPVNGKVIERFSNKSNRSKGLDIVAKKGSPVRATANGKVVYSGSGLRGYGQLVIIKHNDTYLSAYAHNDKIHVSENEFVKAGQRIADLGNSGAEQNKLHFEIRYKGKPVDPLNYLPKSGLF